MSTVEFEVQLYITTVEFEVMDTGAGEKTRIINKLNIHLLGALWCSSKASDSRSRGTGFDPH